MLNRRQTVAGAAALAALIPLASVPALAEFKMPWQLYPREEGLSLLWNELNRSVRWHGGPEAQRFKKVINVLFGDMPIVFHDERATVVLFGIPTWWTDSPGSLAVLGDYSSNPRPWHLVDIAIVRDKDHPPDIADHSHVLFARYRQKLAEGKYV